jgi:16S rRNA processing protein RimM
VEDQNEFVAVGRVGPAHGVRGEVYVEPWTDDVESRFVEGASFLTEPAARGPLTIASMRMSNRKLMITFEGIEERNAAAAIHHVQLLMPAKARPLLADPDDFYDTDLIGLAVTTVTGQSLGPVIDVVHAAAADYLLLKIEGRDHLVPFVNAIVPSVDLGAGTVTIDPPEGLFDLWKN